MTAVRPKKDIPFTQVLELVKQGYGEKEAIKKFYKGTGHFYAKMTDAQKLELRFYKTLQRKQGKVFGRDIDSYFNGGEENLI